MSQEKRRIKRKVRNSYVVSTTSIALVVFMLGCIGYVILNSLAATGRMKERFVLTVMLERDAPVEQVGRELEADQVVGDVQFIPREQAAADFANFINKDFNAFLDDNPLPDSYEVRLKAEYYDKESVEAFEKRVMAMEGVDEVVYQRGVLDQIGKNLGKFNLVLMVFGAMLLFISLVLLNNTIKVTVFSKRYMISTMKLVGATHRFIIRPFVWTALLQGLIAGVVAGAMLLGMVAGLSEGLPELTVIRDNTSLAVIIGAMIAGGVVISLTFTIFAVRKFLRMHINNIHLY